MRISTNICTPFLLNAPLLPSDGCVDSLQLPDGELKNLNRGKTAQNSVKQHTGTVKPLSECVREMQKR